MNRREKSDAIYLLVAAAVVVRVVDWIERESVRMGYVWMPSSIGGY